MTWNRLAGLCFGLLLIGLAGCADASRAKVKGKVVANGQPVTEGSLLFAPAGGENAADARPATGIVQPDGTFVLGTDSETDGAAIGRHKVRYNPPAPVGPPWDGYGTPPVMTYSPFHGHVPKEAEVEVKAGENDLTIELLPPKS